jgi:hypothetical protein
MYNSPNRGDLNHHKALMGVACNGSFMWLDPLPFGVHNGSRLLWAPHVYMQDAMSSQMSYYDQADSVYWFFVLFV